MSRIVAAAILVSSMTVASALYFRAPDEAPALEQARQDQLLERMDRLEHMVAAAAARSVTGASATAVLVEKPVAQEEPEAAVIRDNALRAGNAVVERALQGARWSRQDKIELNLATATLNGPERSEIYARISAAVNEDRLQIDPDAFGL
jgi:hypothetical protein